ncbi:hypothetical protein Tco_0788394 [Tanacetum coccineum]
MASVQFSSGPGLQSMTLATFSLGLVPNLVPQQPFNLPTRNDWDRLFQHMFDEYFNSPSSAVSSVPIAAAPRAVEIADSPSSITIDQDAPSSSTSSTNQQKQSLIISQGVEEPIPNALFDDPCHEPLHDVKTDEFGGVLKNKASRSNTLHKESRKRLITGISGLQTSQSPRGIFINQSQYAFEIIKKYGMLSSDSVDTPMVEKNKLDEDLQGTPIDATLYRGMIGSLNTRSRLGDKTMTFGSTSGSAQFLGDKLVSWSSKKQKSTVISSTEAEYIALSGCYAQILWMRSQLTDYRIGFAKAFIKVSAAKELKKEVTMLVPNEDGTAHTKVCIQDECEWKPPLCMECHVFGHTNAQCPKSVKEPVTVNEEVQAYGFTTVSNGKRKGKKQRTINWNKQGGIKLNKTKTFEYRLVAAQTADNPVKQVVTILVTTTNHFEALNDEAVRLVDEGKTSASNKEEGLFSTQLIPKWIQIVSSGIGRPMLTSIAKDVTLSLAGTRM